MEAATRRQAPWIGIVGLLAAAVVAGGCAAPPKTKPEPVEKSVVSIGGVRHGPILITPDRVAAGDTLHGTVKAQTQKVLVQAIARPGDRPVGEASLEGIPGSTLHFSIDVAPDVRGTLLVRALDRSGLYMDKEIEVAETGSGGR